MLTQQLRELEEDGFVNRVVFPVIPPKVEYSLTDNGKEVIPIVDVIRNFGLKLMKEENVNEIEWKIEADQKVGLKTRYFG